MQLLRTSSILSLNVSMNMYIIQLNEEDGLIEEEEVEEDDT